MTLSLTTILTLFALLIAGCAGTGERAPQAAGLRFEERDIETPSAFALTAKGLWNGQPSFGGVWIAVPGEVQPERVRIVNLDNDLAVVGALFKRERPRAGPPIELSSDAAAALGVKAGRPMRLRVVALRRETVELPSAPQPPAPRTDPVAMSSPAPVAPPPIAPMTQLPAPAAVQSAAPPEAEPVLSAAPREIPAARPAPARSAPGAATADTASAPQAVVSPLAKPFLQLGLFGDRNNVKTLLARLERKGLVGVEQRFARNGRSLSRILVGPAMSDDELAQNLASVRALGIRDAYAVAR